ncbi:MAG: hypothetical protein QOF13_2143 [Solirubrobacterales bacterium]|nr:hypothetical protein [Solirubrobacterales bacterium]
MLLVTGCGSGSGNSADASGGEVTVETGSLSKAQFIERADRICEENKQHFQKEYEAFVKAVTSSPSPTEQIAKLAETIFVPNFEKDVEEISVLGAPRGDQKKVAAFLNALQQRLDEIREQPIILGKTQFPLAKATKMATAYGSTGCAESFS